MYVSRKLAGSQLLGGAPVGAKATKLLIEQPTKFEFMTNSRTAKVPSLTIAPSLLLRAVEVIQ